MLKLAAVLTFAVVAVACGASPDPGTTKPAGSSSSSSSGGTSDGEALSVFPSKLYTGFDGTHAFKAPAVAVNGGTTVTWKAADSSIVDIKASSDGTQVTFTGKKDGTTKITATSDGKTATATITVVKYDAAAYDVGQKRYTTNGDGTQSQACKNCHGTGKDAPDHTPTEIDADTDTEVQTTFLTGVDPEGRPLPVQNHKWNVTDAEKLGLMAYLRALPPSGFPEPDNATANKNAGP